MKNTRKTTCHLLELAESGSTFPRWEDIARECLAYMSEADVEDMARVAGWLPEEEEEEEEEDEEEEEAWRELADKFRDEFKDRRIQEG